MKISDTEIVPIMLIIITLALFWFRVGLSQARTVAVS